jgi:hypothetical protein
MLSPKRLYLTSDRSRVVEENDPDAAFLLVGAGCELNDTIARQYGLLDVQAKAIKAAPENKAIETPPENKASQLVPDKPAKKQSK